MSTYFRTGQQAVKKPDRTPAFLFMADEALLKLTLAFALKL